MEACVLRRNWLLTHLNNLFVNECLSVGLVDKVGDQYDGKELRLRVSLLMEQVWCQHLSR